MASLAKEEYQFLVELDDEFKCLICLGVARDPLQHEECGKLFCKDCLEKYGKNKPCPNCRQENSQYYVDKRGKRAIEALRVKCHNAGKNCPWEGTVGTVEAHVINTCQFTLLPCPNQCQDDKAEIRHYMRKELDQHLHNHCPNRQYRCQFCGEEGTYATITYIHDEACQKKPIPCPNKECKVTMQREMVPDHVERECEFTVVPCKYWSFGCIERRRRGDMASHERSFKQFHLELAMEATLQIMRDNMELKSDCQKLKSDNHELKNDCQKLKKENEKLKREITRLTSTVSGLQISLGNPRVFKLTDYDKKMHDIQYSKFSPFYLSPERYHVALWVRAKGCRDHASVFITIVSGDYDSNLKWLFVGDVTFTLLNQLEDKNHYIRTTSLTAGLNAQVGCINGHEGWGFSKFIPHTALGFDSVKNTQYLKDDSMYFKMCVELKH